MNDNINNEQQSVSIEPNYQSLAQSFMQESKIQRERAEDAELKLLSLNNKLDGLRSLIADVVRDVISDIRHELDYQDLAQYIDYRQLSYELDYSDLAYHIDNDDVAEHICIDSLADNLSNRIEVTFKG